MVASLEGIIKKKNSYGQFKERFCAVTDSYFLGYKLSSKGQKTDDVKEKVDLRDICEVSVQGDCFEIELKNGEKMTFKASKPQDWVDSILAKLNVLQKDLGLDKLNITDDVANMEGLIKKKNSAGQWKDRYALFKNHTLFTFKPKGNAPSKEQKEAILLKDIDSTRILTSESFEIELMSGEKLVFQTPKAREWASTISAKANVASEIYKQSLASFNIHGLHLSGWLMKKSHNKYQGYQERFVKLEGNTFKYFKKDSDPEVLGSACMNTVEFVRPYDDTPDCQVFELKDEDRVFIFQAASKKEMLHWVSTIDRIKSACQTKKQEEVKAKLEAETPIRIRWFDEKGVAEFTDIIRTDLADCYPDPSTMEEITLRKHLEFASELVGYMTDFVPEIQRCESRPARYDILALMMTEVNNLLQERFSSFLQVEENDRSEYIEMANLGDLHALIDWLTRYQVTLRGIRCPVYSGDNAANASTAAAVLSVSHLNPKQCSAFDAVPNLCRLYVFGGSTGAKGGAAAHLYDHCIKVWENVISNPEEMLQRHNDGTFFTHTPIDMWEAINQHVSLARSTHNPILHVMIAEKVVSSLNAVFDKIIDYIKTLDTNQNTEMKEIELEFFSALANDTAIHIEEVIQLIDSFSVEEIRQRIDDIFDPLTTNLVNCGQACLKRLAGLVMSDVQTLLDEVFMPDWMEGKQMRVATATISDYMRDFEEYLVEFWAKKFQYTILEEVVISYTRSVLFAKNKGMTQASSTAVSNNQQGNQGFMSSIFQKTKQITQTIITFVPSHVPVDEESLGRLAQDVNILNAFFSQKAGQELATEFLVIINEVSLLLFLDMTGLLAHFDKCVTEFPSAAPAVKEVVTAVMRLRYDVFSKSDIEDFLQEIQPALERSIEVAKGMEKEGVPEGKLGLLYSDVVPKDVLNSPQKITLAQRMKLMSNISFGVGNKSGKEEEDEEDFDGEQVTRNRAASVEESTKTNQLLDEVMEVLQQKEEENDMLIKEQEEAEREEELQRRKALVLSYDGYLEKKSPAHNLWQVKNHFKPFHQHIMHHCT